MAVPGAGGVLDFSQLPGARRAAAAVGAVGAAAAEAAAEGPAVPVPDLVIAIDERTLEQLLQLSTALPVVLEIWQRGVPESEALAPVLERAIRAREGRLLLARLDAAASPQLLAALQIAEVPAVLALIGGRPIGLFSGAPDAARIGEVLDELLTIAAEAGVAGRAQPSADPDAEQAAPEEPPLPPLHQEAYDAIERGDYAAAAEAYRRALAEQPADADARAGLAQVSLLGRLEGKTADELRRRAAEAPEQLEAQFDVADLDLSGGHVEDAFDRLLTLFPALDAEGRAVLRQRLLELFEVVGGDDPRVSAARRRLANLLF